MAGAGRSSLFPSQWFADTSLEKICGKSSLTLLTIVHTFLVTVYHKIYCIKWVDLRPPNRQVCYISYSSIMAPAYMPIGSLFTLLKIGFVEHVCITQDDLNKMPYFGVGDNLPFVA